MMPFTQFIERLVDGLVVAGIIEHFAHRNAGANADDELTAAAHDLILDAVSDADRRGQVQDATGLDWRAGLTVEEAEALRQEAELRRMKNRN